MRMLRTAVMTAATPVFLLLGSAVGTAHATPISVPAAGCIGASGQYVCTTGAVGVDPAGQTQLFDSPTDVCVFVKCVAEGEPLVTAPVGAITPGTTTSASLVDGVIIFTARELCSARGGTWQSGTCV